MKKREFKKILQTANLDELLGLGFCLWDEKSKLYLIPHKFYNLIPKNFKIITIGGNTELFKHGKTDDDQRFGMLAYGIVIK
jgi:hypothetical protein